MRDNLNSDTPGIVDDTSDGDLGANAGEPTYGSLAQSQEREVVAEELAQASPAAGHVTGSVAEAGVEGGAEGPQESAAGVATEPTEGATGHVL